MALDSIADAMLARLPQSSPQEISSLVWAYAKLRHAHPPLFRAALEHAESSLKRYNIQVRLAGCLVVPPSLPHAVLQPFLATCWQPSMLTRRAVCWVARTAEGNCLPAHIHKHALPLRTLITKAERALSMQALSILCWSCAVMRERPPAPFMRAMQERLEQLIERKARGTGVPAPFISCSTSWGALG